MNINGNTLVKKTHSETCSNASRNNAKMLKFANYTYSVKRLFLLLKNIIAIKTGSRCKFAQIGSGENRVTIIP